MKKIGYMFWDNDTDSPVQDSFYAIGFSMSYWGVSFSVDLSEHIYSYSWVELENMVGNSVVFTVAAD